MNLYTNGCSWTWGGGLEEHFRNPITEKINNDNRLKIVWPHYLGEILGVEKVTNLGMGCSSNQRIVRTTFDWLSKTSKSELENTIAVIQFSEFSRFNYYYDEGQYLYENEPKNWYNCKIDLALPDLDYESQHEVVQFLLQNNKHRVKSPIEEIYDTLTYLNALQQLFKQFGIDKVYYWHIGHGWHQWPSHFKTYLLDNFTVLDDYNTRNGEFEIWSYERVDGKNPYSHPSLKGHKQLAECIYKEMVRKGYK